MNENFLKSMKDAFHLLRTKGPSEATAAVQRALGAAGVETGQAAAHEPHAAADWANAWARGRAAARAADHADAPANPYTEAYGNAHADARPDAGANAPHHARATRDASASASASASRTSGAATPGTFSTHTFSNSAGQRQYKLYVPAVYQQQQQPLPLVVMLHGCTQNADDFAAGTRMNEMAERHGLIVVYPNQSQAANHSKCWNWFKPGDQQRDRGEPSLIAGITREVIEHYRVDEARVYIAGLSAGGAMAHVLLNTSPELFAAGCVHSGLAHGCAKDLPSALAAMKGGKPQRKAAPYRSVQAPQRPLIVFHGDADATVHPSNALDLVAGFDQEASTVCMPGASAASTQRGRSGSSSGSERGATLQRLVAANGVPAEYWSIHGAGHAWAGGSSRGSYTDPAGPDATALMLRFFLDHPRSN